MTANARVVALVTLAAAALVVVVGTAPAFGSVRDLFGTTGDSRIAFTSFRNGRFHLYVMNVDGRKQHRLTAPVGGTRPGNSPPAWSPDGQKVAFVDGPGVCSLDFHFVSGRGLEFGDVDIYVANRDGSGRRRLTRDPAVDCVPVWSPDGRRIAFERALVRREGDTVVGFDHDVYVINADGSGERNLTGDAVSAGGPAGPIWSPDGRRIAFWSGPDGNGWVYVMNADGSERRMLARNEGHLAWSPDGRKILLARGGHQGPPATNAYVVVANTDGSGLRTLTRVAGDNGSHANWSPDGRRIVFVSDRDGNLEVYVMNADGSGQRNLTRHPGRDSEPAWSPDGRMIAFTTKREGNFEIYVMNADGSGQRNLTHNPAPDRFPVWSPAQK